MRDHLAGLDATHVSYSELNTLATCEEKWYQNYVLRIEGGSSVAMRKGTVFHKLAEEWWKDDAPVHSAWWAADVEQCELDDDVLDDIDWLFARYVTVWTPQRKQGWHRPDWCSGELSLDANVPLPNGTVINVRVTPDDFLVDPDGRLVLIERKTMASWQRLDLVDVTPQESIQVWAARANGIGVDRVGFDAIKSYRWALQKPSQKDLIEQAAELDAQPWNYGDGDYRSFPQESKRKTAWAKEMVARHPGVDTHPPEDSFQFVEVWRDDEQTDGAVAWMQAILERRADLLAAADKPNARMPIKSIGNQCRMCSYQDNCWTELAFPDRGAFVIDEEDE